MGTTLDYTLTRATPFTDAEVTLLEQIMATANASMVEQELEGESFDLYPDKDQPGTRLQGWSKPPLDFGHFAGWFGLAEDALTAMRRAIPNAEWQVSVEEHEYEWDDATGWDLGAAAFAELGDL